MEEWNVEQISSCGKQTTHQIENLRDTDTGAHLTAQEHLAGQEEKNSRKCKTGVQQKM